MYNLRKELGALAVKKDENTTLLCHFRDTLEDEDGWNFLEKPLMELSKNK